ncbi:MAG: Gfo/Idh/MocA family oxidoreductase [Candidatus Latescibacteria bacterium]|nr:Gfo/Idh/MocA family oxidoreductase [Candidatus Latescibacterota bacterium]
MDDVRLGLAGLGNRGCYGWLKCMKTVPGCKVVALCDPIGPRLQAGLNAAADPEVKGFSDFGDMLTEADVDAVAIVVQPENQPALILESLAAGKHTIGEVPLAYSLEDCWDIVTTVEKTGLTFAMGEQVSHAPFVRAWKQMVDEGRLGKVLYAEGQYCHGRAAHRYWEDSRTGQRLTWEEAGDTPDAVKSRSWQMAHPIWYPPHDLAPILRILDDHVVEVTCMGTRAPGYVLPDFPIADMEVALMRLSKDTVYRQLNAFTAPTPQPWHWYHLMGTKGEVETERAVDADGMWYLSDSHMTTRMPMRWEFTHHQPGIPGAAASGHGGLDFYPIHDFIQCIQTGDTPVVDVYRAANVSAAAAMAGLSVENGSQPMKVPDFRPSEERRAGERP